MVTVAATKVSMVAGLVGGRNDRIGNSGKGATVYLKNREQ
jgi:hypothetical protein